MSCLNLSNGSFTSITFNTSISGTAAGKAISLSPGKSLVVDGNIVLSHNSTSKIKAAIIGGQYLAAMRSENPSDILTPERKVYVISLDTPTPKAEPILIVKAAGGYVKEPTVQVSPGSKTLIAVWGSTDTGSSNETKAGIYRSDNGTLVLSIPPIHGSATINGGEITNDHIVFNYNPGGPKKTPRPKGSAKVTSSNPQNFGSVSIGGCSTTPPTRTFKIRNIGDDCLAINNVSPNGPYSATASRPPLPYNLPPNQVLEVDVSYNPASVGTNNNIKLDINPTPPNGPLYLICNGRAITAKPAAHFSATTFNFGQIPNGATTSSKTLTITNSGTADLNVNVPAGSADGFSWSPVATTLTCGASAKVTIDFTAGLPEGSKSASFEVAHSGSGSPQTIKLTATVCVANPLITAPLVAPIDFGKIEQGFTTVKLLQPITNPGDGALTFTAEIISTTSPNPAAALFGIPDPAGGSIKGLASHGFTVDPVDPCLGPPGTGKTFVPISFTAEQSPGVITGLALRISSTTPAFSRDYPITAEIIPPIPLDIGLVIDRSGSMDSPLGSRLKIDAAISATQLFVDLLRPDQNDRVTIVRYNQESQIIQPIVEISGTKKAFLRKLLSSSNTAGTGILPASGMTAIAGGVLKAIEQILSPRKASPPEITRAVVILTDGIENTGSEHPPGSGKWLSVLGGPNYYNPNPNLPDVTTTRASFPSNVNRYAVGLGRSGDVDDYQLSQLMKPAASPYRVSEDLTGLKYFELEKAFTQIFMDVAGVASITDPMHWIGPGEIHEIQFDVLRGDRSALIILYDWEGHRLPFHCETPMGEVLDPTAVPPGFQLRSGVTDRTRYIEIWFPKEEPDRYASENGKPWKVVIQHPGRVCFGVLGWTSVADAHVFIQPQTGFVSNENCKDITAPLLYGLAIGVGSDFRMQPFVTPGPVYIGETIQLTAVLSEAGLPVLNGNVMVNYTSPIGSTGSITLLDAGKENDGSAGDGEYARSFTGTFSDGVYEFRFRAVGLSREGQTVTREAVRTKEVLRKGVPPGGDGHPDDQAPGGGTRFDDRDCCSRLELWLRILAIFLVVIVLLLIWMALR